ncbi:MAG: hypothetical protein J0I20_00695 [Chloroflexi bacterium]|nr:hypothetical protein [Chloroflexota bacterium]
MKRKDPKDKSVTIAVTVEPETSVALEKRVKETGNRSFIVEKALRAFLGLDENSELEKKAS